MKYYQGPYNKIASDFSEFVAQRWHEQGQVADVEKCRSQIYEAIRISLLNLMSRRNELMSERDDFLTLVERFAHGALTGVMERRGLNPALCDDAIDEALANLAEDAKLAKTVMDESLLVEAAAQITMKLEPALDGLLLPKPIENTHLNACFTDLVHRLYDISRQLTEYSSEPEIYDHIYTAVRDTIGELLHDSNAKYFDEQSVHDTDDMEYIEKMNLMKVPGVVQAMEKLSACLVTLDTGVPPKEDYIGENCHIDGINAFEERLLTALSEAITPHYAPAVAKIELLDMQVHAEQKANDIARRLLTVMNDIHSDEDGVLQPEQWRQISSRLSSFFVHNKDATSFIAPHSSLSRMLNDIKRAIETTCLNDHDEMLNHSWTRREQQRGPDGPEGGHAL